MDRVSIFVVLVALAACGDDGAAVLDAGADGASDMQVTDFGADALSDSASVDDAAADVALDAATPDERVLSWQTGPALVRGVDHHSTMVLSDGERARLVVVGGVETTRGTIRAMSPDVQVADILEDGTLGAFRTLDPLSFPWSFHAFAQSPDGTGYVLGGIAEDEEGEVVAVGAIAVMNLQDGALRIRPGESLPQVFRHASAEYVNQTLYVIGGLGGRGPQADVVAADVSADGLNGTWREVAALPAPRTHHVSCVHDGAIYVFGGFGPGDTPLQDVLRSVHDEEGEIIDWEVVAVWDEPSWTSSALVVDDDVYLIGGGVFDGSPGGATNLARVTRWRIGDELEGPFEAQDPLPLARSHVHQTPVWEGRVYSVGGRAGTTFSTTDQTFVGTLGRAAR